MSTKRNKERSYTDTQLYRDLMRFSNLVAEASPNVKIDFRKSTIQELLKDCLATAKYIRLTYDETLNLERKEKYCSHLIRSIKNIEVDFDFSKDLKSFSPKTEANLSFELGKIGFQAMNWYTSFKKKNK